MASDITTRNADLNGEAHGIVRQVLTAPFRTIRAAYWAMNHDAKVRSQGELTVGRVVDKRTRTQTHTDSECGDVNTTHTHYVKYGFQVDGVDSIREKKVGDLGILKRGDAINVYFLRTETGPDSAIEWKPEVWRGDRSRVVRATAMIR